MLDTFADLSNAWYRDGYNERYRLLLTGVVLPMPTDVPTAGPIKPGSRPAARHDLDSVARWHRKRGSGPDTNLEWYC